MAEILINLDSIQLIKMTDEEYFSKKYSKYISNSQLSLLNPEEGGSVELFKKGFKSEYSDSFALGSAIHAALLQPEYYEIGSVTKPNGKLGVWAEMVFKLRSEGNTILNSILLASEKSDYYKYKLHGTRLKTAIKSALPFYLERLKIKSLPDKNLIFLSHSLKPKFEECLLNISKNKIEDILYPSGILKTPEVFNEYAILCDLEYVDEETGEIILIPFKSKLDNFSINEEESEVSLVDLKSTSKPVNYFMGNVVKKFDDDGNYTETNYIGSFQKYRYYRQMGIYLWLLQTALKHLRGKNFKYKVSMLVIETVPNFNSKVFLVNNSYIKLGLAEFKKLLIIFVNNGLHDWNFRR